MVSRVENQRRLQRAYDVTLRSSKLTLYLLNWVCAETQDGQRALLDRHLEPTKLASHRELQGNSSKFVRICHL